MNQLPEKFLEKLNVIFPSDVANQALKSFEKEKPVSFRVNILKTTPEKLAENLKQKKFIIEQMPWYPDAFILKNKSVRELTETEAYKNGQLYIQNLSSMIPALIMNPKPDEKVLDIAAAPGSKTTQIAGMMNNSGELVANDMSRERLYKLKFLLEQQGVTNTRIVNVPGQTIWQKYPEYFDKVLLDAPCSMEGRFLADEPQTYKDWSQKKVKVLGSRQHYLLRSAISAAKVGGTIIYSTCTISPEENEEVIDWILKKEHGSIEIETIKLRGVEFEHGLTYWNKNLNPNISETARILPSELFEGFYIAKLKKLKPTVKQYVSFE